MRAGKKVAPAAASAAAAPVAAAAPSCVRADKNGRLLHLAICVKPGAAQSSLTGLVGGELHVRVAAPPVDGAANAALLSFLAESLSLRKGALSIARGASGRNKSVTIDSEASGKISQQELQQRIEQALEGK